MCLTLCIRVVLYAEKKKGQIYCCNQKLISGREDLFRQVKFKIPHTLCAQFVLQLTWPEMMIGEKLGCVFLLYIFLGLSQILADAYCRHAAHSPVRTYARPF